MNIRYLIVGIDFTPSSINALQYAVDMAAETNHEILAVNVYSNEKDKIAKEVALKQLVENVRNEQGVEVNYRAILGDVENDLAIVAETVAADLVILGMHLPDMMESAFGSHTMRIIKGTQVPYLVVNEHIKYKSVRRIGVTLDLEKESVQVVKAVADIALSLNAEVHLIAKHHLEKNKSIREDINISVAKEYLDKMGIENVCVEITYEDYVYGLIDYCDDNDIRILAATYHQENFEFFGTGFVQNLIQNRSRIPVLTLECEQIEVGSPFVFMQ